MARIIMWVADQEKSGDIYTDVKRYKSGDVISIVADEQFLTSHVTGRPDWRVLDMPGVPVERLTHLLATDFGFNEVEATKANRVLRRRAVTIDLDMLAAIESDLVKKEEFKDPKKAEKLWLDMRKPSKIVINPAVIGGDPRVIG